MAGTVLINPQTGEEEFVFDDQLQDRLAAGYQPRVGGTATVYRPSGSEETIRSEDVGVVADRSQVGFAGPREQQISAEQAFNERYYDTLGQEALTALEGAASGVTFGLSDKALMAMGADTALRAEVNPGIRTVSQLAGAVAPGIFSGGTGFLGSAARALPSGALVARTTAMGAKLGGVRGMAVATALEGAAFGAGQAVSNLAIADVPLTSEAGLTEIGLSALLGAGTGAGLGAALGGAAKVAARLDARASQRGAGILNPLESEAGAKLVFDAKRVTRGLGQTADDLLDTAARVAQGSRVTGSPNQLRAWASERQAFLQETASKLAVEARAANLGQLANQLDNVADGATAISNTLLKPGMRVDSKSFNAIKSRLNKLEGVVRKADPMADAALDAIDNKWHTLTGSGGIAPRTAKGARGVPRKADPELKALVEEVNDARQVFRDSWGLGSKDVLNETAFKRFQRFEADQARHAAASFDEYQSALQKLSTRVSDPDLGVALQSHAKELGELVGGAVPKGGPSATEMMKDLGLLVAGNEIPDLPGPADELMKLYLLGRVARSGSSVAKNAGPGRWVGRYAGYKMGGAAAQAAGVQSGFGGYFMRGKAANMAQAVLNGTGALGQATGSVVSRIERATSKLLKGSAAARKVLGPGAGVVLGQARFAFDEPQTTGKRPKYNAQEAFKQRSAELAAVVSNPLSAHQRIYDNLTPVRQAHPLVADAMEMKAMEAAQFLYDKMPKDPGTINSFGESRWKPSEAALVQWSNYVRAVSDPVSVIEDVADGTVTPQGAEALRTVYPAIFAEAQKLLVQGTPELRKNSSYDQRGRLSILFGVPVDSAYSREFSQFSQQQWVDRLSDEKAIDGAQLSPEEPSAGQKLLGQ